MAPAVLWAVLAMFDHAPRILVPFALSLLVATVACTTETRSNPAAGAAVCGNGVLEASEECESFDLRGATCDSLNLAVGVLRCTSECKLDTTGCGGKCGDGVVSGDEQCDGANLGTATCASLLGVAATTGNLSCSSDCYFITDACSEPAPVGALLACDPAAGNACAAPASCVNTARGNFCLEACDLAARPSTCGENRYCEDVGGKGACADRPLAGQGCSDRSGCIGAGNTCIPTFLDATGKTISTCAPSCPASEVGKGQGSCAAGSSCTAVGNGPFELQSQTACRSSADCDAALGYACNPVLLPGAAEVLRCTRPYGQCAPVTPLYAFDGSTPPESSLCDRVTPTRGPAKCGLRSTRPLPNPARVDCVEHFPGTPQIGVCTAFCENESGPVGGAPAPDLSCGDDAACAVPATPEFFVGQGTDTPVGCPVGAAPCGASFPFCVDLGRGLECARAAKVCVPN